MSGKAPDGVCGFMLEPDDLNLINEFNSCEEWHVWVSACCCFRDTWRDYDKCIWHADVDDKPVDELVDDQSEHWERLDGAVLTGIELRNSLRLANYWLVGADCSRSNFQKALFSSTNLSYANFTEADLTHAALPNSVLRSTNLSRVKLVQSKLHDTDFQYASLTNASLRRATISDADFGNADLTMANLNRSQIKDTYFSGATLEDADLKDADISGVSFRDAQLNSADFSSGIITNGDLKDKNFDYTKYFDSDNVGHTSLTPVDFREADLSSANFRDADLSFADFRGAELSFANFRDSNLHNAIFGTSCGHRGFDTPANISNAEFQHANLTNALLQCVVSENGDFEGSDFTGADIRDATFTNVNAPGAIFTNSKMQKCDLYNANLGDSTMRQANLEQASLLEANLDGSDLTDAKVHNCRLQDVYISEETTFSDRCIYEKEARRAIETGSRTDEDILKIRKAVSIYRTYQRLHRENSLPGDIADYYYREKDMRRVQALTENDTRDWIVRALQRWVMGYGERPWRVVGTSLIVVIVFGIIYPLAGGVTTPSANGNPIRWFVPIDASLSELPGGTLLASLYFSLVTFTTLGYGDIQPITAPAQTLAAIESAMGAVLVALLVAVLTRRAMR